MNITDKQEIADKFNDFFTKIGPDLSDKIPSPQNSYFHNYLNRNITSTFTFKTIDERSVKDAINDLAPKSSCGVDEISSKLLKNLSNTISSVLTVTIYQSLVTGIFPEKLKLS